MNGTTGYKHSVSGFYSLCLSVNVEIKHPGYNISDLRMRMAVDSTHCAGIEGIFHTHQFITKSKDLSV